MSDTDDEVLEPAERLRVPSFVEPRIRVARGVGRRCINCTLDLDEMALAVSCTRCHRRWEPFQALLHIAREWSNLTANRDALRNEVNQLNAQRMQLRKEVQTLKGKAKRATVRT